MGIDYVIDLDCAAKQDLTTEGMVELIKARARANAILAMARQDDDQRPPSEITFEIAINRNGSIETTAVSVQALLDQAAALDRHRGGCADCPANRASPHGFGCYDSVGYPIEDDTEQFLLSRLPDTLESPAGFMFSSAMRDFAWDGAQAAHMRTQDDVFFRLREPPGRRWPESTESTEPTEPTDLAITGDQLFHMMFHVGHIGSSHAMMLCLFFGLLSLGDDAAADVERANTVDPESGNAQQMVEFLNTLAFAASQKLDILIDG